MSQEPPRVWAILGRKRGDNNQVLALANALGIPFETRQLNYNRLRKLPKRLLGKNLASVLPDARKLLQPPWPDLVIAIGHHSIPVVRWIRRKSGGRAKLVRIGNPRMDPSEFDLIITTPQYPVPDAPQVMRLALPIGTASQPLQMSEEERAWLEALPRPHRLMVIGGPTKMWAVTPEDVAAAARRLLERSENDGGTVIGVGSPRTEAAVSNAVEQALAGRHRFVRGNLPGYRTLLYDADEIHVTADSVSMISEAIYTGKPVGLIPIVPSAFGRLRLRAADLGLVPAPPRDLRKVWQVLKAERLVGSIDEPVAGSATDPVGRAAEAVLRLLGC